MGNVAATALSSGMGMTSQLVSGQQQIGGAKALSSQGFQQNQQLLAQVFNQGLGTITAQQEADSKLNADKIEQQAKLAGATTQSSIAQTNTA